jgi:hypothetical protein
MFVWIIVIDNISEKTFDNESMKITSMQLLIDSKYRKLTKKK